MEYINYIRATNTQYPPSLQDYHSNHFRQSVHQNRIAALQHSDSVKQYLISKHLRNSHLHTKATHGHHHKWSCNTKTKKKTKTKIDIQPPLPSSDIFSIQNQSNSSLPLPSPSLTPPPRHIYSINAIQNSSQQSNKKSVSFLIDPVPPTPPLPNNHHRPKSILKPPKNGKYKPPQMRDIIRKSNNLTTWYNRSPHLFDNYMRRQIRKAAQNRFAMQSKAKSITVKCINEIAYLYTITNNISNQSPSTTKSITPPPLPYNTNIKSDNQRTSTPPPNIHTISTTNYNTNSSGLRRGLRKRTKPKSFYDSYNVEQQQLKSSLSIHSHSNQKHNHDPMNDDMKGDDNVDISYAVVNVFVYM